MVGSTALSEAVDPELLGALIRRYQDATAGAIGRYGGFVAKFMGDGVLAYFGFPHAFEDAAERAVRAAIGILAEVGKIKRPDGAALQARVGIATGLVVVGEIIGAGSAQERTIVGETPNLAARLQALALPDTILISEATQNLLGGLFELESAGAHELKGFAKPMPVWRVVGEGTIDSRFAAIRAGAATPLVGRANEMGLLLDRSRLARQGEGQIVTLIGEAGIGKSRLIEGLQEAVGGEPHGLIYLQCSPYHNDNALYPVIHHISRNAGFAAGDSPEQRIEKLRALFSHRTAADPAAVPLLAELLSIPNAPPVPGSPTAAQRKMATIALLADEIVRRGEVNTMLLIVEDAHWMRRHDAGIADPHSRLHRPRAPFGGRHRPTGFCTTVAYARAVNVAHARPPRPNGLRRSDCRHSGIARIICEHRRGYRGEDRRCSFVRRGIDEERCGVGGRGGRCGASFTQGFAGGAP